MSNETTHPDRQSAPWLTEYTFASILVRRAMKDIGIEEIPPGSNRSGRIDEYVQAVGSPLGSYWCAAALTAWFRECDAKTPPKDAGSCESWASWARQTQTTTLTPVPGDAVLYLNSEGHAHHCGIIVRVTPEVLTVEGNTSVAPGDRNGTAVLLKRLGPGKTLFIQPRHKDG